MTQQEWQEELERLRYRPWRGVWASYWDAWLQRNRTPAARRMLPTPRQVARMSATERAAMNEGALGEQAARDIECDATVYPIIRPRSSGRPGGAYVVHPEPPGRSSRGLTVY